MPSFTIRVELHDANWQQYIDMARDLARQGITDVITASDDKRYKLSPAEYNYEGDVAIDDVLNAVRDSANKTGKKNAVFVTEAIRRQWIGLPVIQSRQTA